MQSVPFMPFSQTLIGIAVELKVLLRRLHRHPISLTAQHHMHTLGWTRQRGIDSRCVGVDQVWPATVINPQGGTALPAEMPLRFANIALKMSMVVINMGFSLDLQALVEAAEIDRVAATASSFSADGTITEHKRIGMRRFQLETNSAALA